MNSQQTDLQALQAINKRFIHNFVTNDVAAHDALLHPDFRSITPAGGHVGREAYLAYWANGFDPAVLTYWDMRDERIDILGDVALVTATNKWVRVQNGMETAGMTCYTDTYVRATGGKWLCVLAQLTPVSAGNFPDDKTIVVRYLRGVLQG